MTATLRPHRSYWQIVAEQVAGREGWAKAQGFNPQMVPAEHRAAVFPELAPKRAPKRAPRPRRVQSTGLTWRRARESEGFAPHYESTDGRWRVMPIAYTVPCDGYVDGHIGCPGNTEHTHEEWQLEELVDGDWVEDEELYPRLRDAKAVAARMAAR